MTGGNAEPAPQPSACFHRGVHALGGCSLALGPGSRVIHRPAVQQVPKHARATWACRAERRGPTMRQEHPLASVRQIAALQPLRAALDWRPGSPQRFLDPGRSRLKLPDSRIASCQAEAAGEFGPHLCPMITRCSGLHAASVLKRPLEGLVHRPWARWMLSRFWLSAVTTAHAGCLPPGSPWLSAETAAHAGHLPPASAPGGSGWALNPGPVGCQRPHRALLRVHIQLPIPIQA